MGEIIDFPLKAQVPISNSTITLTFRGAHDTLWGYNKIAIVGGPGSGKTYFAGLISKHEIEREPMRQVWCSDVLIDIPWEEQPLVITARLEKVDAYIVEGIAVLRALRRGLINPDVVVYRDNPIRPLGTVQARLWNQCQRWWSEWRKENPRRIVYRVVPGEMSRG